jgi:hypothetical protein
LVAGMQDMDARGKGGEGCILAMRSAECRFHPPLRCSYVRSVNECFVDNKLVAYLEILYCSAQHTLVKVCVRGGDMEGEGICKL